MWLSKLRILGSGFTEEEYDLYGFAKLENPHDATNFLSHRLNNDIYRPHINRSTQQYLLEDKWVTHLLFSSLNLPVPRTYGLYHPVFGMANGGSPLCTPYQLLELLDDEIPVKLVLKPRGGRKGRNIYIAEVSKTGSNDIMVNSAGSFVGWSQFIDSLPKDAFNDYDGSYHGWLVQRYIEQHPFMLELNPHTVNTLRVVTFITSSGACRIHLTALRLGRQGSAADNWDKGGLSIFVDPATGRLGRGVFKPAYGGTWTSCHPDTQKRFEDLIVPQWQSILDICKQAAATLSGIRAVGWDIVLTPTGPIILEGNAMWGLPVVQVHTKGYLTSEIRAELEQYRAYFPERLKPILPAIGSLLLRTWRRSNGPRILRKLGRR